MVLDQNEAITDADTNQRYRAFAKEIERAVGQPLHRAARVVVDAEVVVVPPGRDVGGLAPEQAGEPAAEQRIGEEVLEQGPVERGHPAVERVARVQRREHPRSEKDG